MEALREIVHPVNRQIIVDIPSTLKGEMFEVIAFPVKDFNANTANFSRIPPSMLKGRINTKGNIFDSLSTKDWDLPQ